MKKKASEASWLRQRWNRLMVWSPTDLQIERLEKAYRRWVRIADFWLKVAVVLAALYLCIEIGSAFVPGGAVGRVLGGVR